MNHRTTVAGQGPKVNGQKPISDDVAYRVRFGNRIHALREQHGWTQATLADKLGWDTRAIHELENPHTTDSRKRTKKRVRYDELPAIAHAFGITRTELLNGLGDPGEPVDVRGVAARGQVAELPAFLRGD
jgi:transcriptional regulator with XRE-family HTH domain